MAILSPVNEQLSLRLRLQGRVQGFGVRPTVARLAIQLKLAGSVRNTLQGLEIEIEGTSNAVSRFRENLLASLPVGCDVQEIFAETTAFADRHGFTIREDDSDGPLSTSVPPDTAVCGECLKESRTAGDRRAGYSLIACASCGPRYSVIRQMPYAREATSLSCFTMCRECSDEYACPANRRLHAQTIACPHCGPDIRAVGANGRRVGERAHALTAGVAALRSGQIIAVRGVGGYQLLCDARDESAVARLRARKLRPAKPFAVLVASIADAEQFAIVNDVERSALISPANPIVILRRKGTIGLAQSIHPGLNSVGVMLPTTALHDQLARNVNAPLVCTSGNREGDPLEHEPVAAERHLADVADLWLHHNRPIAHPIDDSVVRVIGGRVVTFRMARGLAPLPLELPAGPPMMALGGHQKSALAWCNGTQCVLGPHVGDLERLSTRERFLEQLASLEDLYRFSPHALVHDAHPDYFTTQWATSRITPRLSVQHHHAHIAAGMLEHGLLDEPVLGVAFDGTGLSDDRTIWGGEFLLARNVLNMQRVAHLRPFALPGGEAAIREPWRVAISILQQSVGPAATAMHHFGQIDQMHLANLLTVLKRSHLHPVTTSSGRLFDAAACLILGRTGAQYDGELAMRLEDIADPSDTLTYPLPLTADQPRQLDWRPLFKALSNDVLSQVAPGAMAMRFHRALAAGIVAVVREWPGLPVVLGGGVFQNRSLCELVVAELGATRRLCLPGRIPPNDGGLAAGQLAIALATPRFAA